VSNSIVIENEVVSLIAIAEQGPPGPPGGGGGGGDAGTLESVAETGDFTLGATHRGKRVQVAKTGAAAMIDIPQTLPAQALYQVRWDNDGNEAGDEENVTARPYFQPSGDAVIRGADDGFLDDDVFYALIAPGDVAEIHVRSNGDGNSAMVSITGNVAPLELPDTVAPVLTSPAATETSATTATIGVATDEDNGTWYWVITASATPPTAQQIIDGEDHTGSAAVVAGDKAVSADGAQADSVTGLTAETAYRMHSVHADEAGNRSNVVTSAEFTTDEAGGGSSTVFGPLTFSGGSGGNRNSAVTEIIKFGAANLAPATGGLTHVRLTLTLTALTETTGEITEVYFGQKAAAGDDIDFKASPGPVQITFASSPTITGDGVTTQWVSDWIELGENYDHDVDYVFAASGVNFNPNFVAQSGNEWWDSGPAGDADTVDKTLASYGSNGALTAYLSKIEIGDGT
jgi:hypothetical protein